MLVLTLQIGGCIVLRKIDKEELSTRYNNEYTFVMICKKYLKRNNFCLKWVAQITYKDVWFCYKLAAHINILF